MNHTLQISPSEAGGLAARRCSAAVSAGAMLVDAGRILAGAWLLTLLLLGRSVASEALHGERTHDEIWLVSARQVGCVRAGTAPNLSTHRYETNAGWVAADIAELFHPSAPDQILVIYVHGNRVESGQAACEGRYVYQLLTSQVEHPGSIRFVIWSWPSAQVRGQLRDVRLKAERTDASSYCLGWFLAQLPDDQRVSLLGYSFGARIASGALHLLGGGHLAGLTLPPRGGPNGVQARVVMLAAAMHRSWLRPQGCHELAWQQLDFLLNLFNGCDPVLKRYPHLYKGSRAQALGFTGMYARDPGPWSGRIEQRDVCGTVDKSHVAIHYFQNPQLLRRVRETLFWDSLRPDRPLRAARHT